MSSRNIKKTSKLLLKLQSKSFLKLNLISIILNIFYYTSINFTVLYLVNNFTAEQLNDMMASGQFLNQSMRQTILVMGFELFAMMIKVGVQYTLLDLMISSGEQNIDHPYKQAVQVFTGKYFANIILLWLISTMLVQYASMLFILPGLYLVFSQIYFIYKVGNEGNKHLGIISTFVNSGMFMRGFKMRYLLLDLSFIGWDILNALTCGLLSIWLTPYKNMSYTLFYRNLVTTKGANQ